MINKVSEAAKLLDKLVSTILSNCQFVTLSICHSPNLTYVDYVDKLEIEKEHQRPTTNEP